MHVEYLDTAMAALATAPKIDPAYLVAIIFDALRAGEHEALTDQTSVQRRAALSSPVEALSQ